MRTAPTARLLARSLFRNAARPAMVARTSPVLLRPISQTAAPRADATDGVPKNRAFMNAIYGTPSSTDQSAGQSQKELFTETLYHASGNASSTSSLDSLLPNQDDLYEPFHIHILSHKHNTHVTVTKPDRGAIISMSTGNIGFKKSKRKSYDAAYQLMAYVLERLSYLGWHRNINKIEVVLRGFGQGRDAAVKVLMAPEGKIWREKVVRVADSTKLKFGGTRSKNPRRV